RSITVSAQGSITADPDIAYFSVGVATDAETARDALSKNTIAMTKLLEGLQGFGIAQRDIQTSAVNVEPRYTLAKDNRTQTLSGYRVTNQVHI
ncbi:SIMPL domain-containing protein, partial [Acinetobacter baumannii]